MLLTMTNESVASFLSAAAAPSSVLLRPLNPVMEEDYDEDEEEFGWDDDEGDDEFDDDYEEDDLDDDFDDDDEETFEDYEEDDEL